MVEYQRHTLQEPMKAESPKERRTTHTHTRAIVRVRTSRVQKTAPHMIQVVQRYRTFTQHLYIALNARASPAAIYVSGYQVCSVAIYGPAGPRVRMWDALLDLQPSRAPALCNPYKIVQCTIR